MGSSSLWYTFCGDCSSSIHDECESDDLIFLSLPASCVNHTLNLGFDVLLLIVFLFSILPKVLRRKSSRSAPFFRSLSSLQLVSGIYNGLLGLAYLCFGIWILTENLRTFQSVDPYHWWVLFVFHGAVWLLLGLAVSLRGGRCPRTRLRMLTILAFVFAAINCGLSIITSVLMKELSIEVVFDVLSLAGAILLLFCAYRGFRFVPDDDDDGVCDPLLAEVDGSSNKSDSIAVTPFATAGFLSRYTFWWLNPLIKKGNEKTLEDDDMPQLRVVDRAESCYLEFMEKLNKQKQSEPKPSIMKTIVLCYWKETLVSGIFAAMKVIAISAGPLLLKGFIRVAEGKESFENEKYVLVVALFFTKILESISQRQWYFRSRLVGIKVRALLTAAIYKKQLRLSNAAKLTHSSAEIMNYVTTDAYRIGEYPFWFHQIWTTVFQLILSILIIYQAVGLATIASLIVIVLTVLCNAPLAKLQHKFQSKLMVAQDGRLKAMTEALVNMKVLKLYAWETHFRRVIERLRLDEDSWLKAVQLRKGYNSFLFWASPLLVSSATFTACYFLGVPLNSSNVFTFVATFRLVQEPVRTIPDVIGVFIQARVAFTRIVRFLDSPEMESENVRKKTPADSSKNHSILFESANISWDENLPKPTLRNINLAVKPGDKIAVCGEVGSGKSTLLAAVLGEVPITHGRVEAHGTMAYVSQSAWIQTGTIRENIVFGSDFDSKRYKDTLESCSLVKDLELMPYGDLTEIGERGVNLSGGQKQRIQLARALYKNADIYLLDDPFSAVDAHTATSLFNEYVMHALAAKTVLLVTHQVDFLPAFDSVLLMSDGEISQAAPYHVLLSSNQEFQNLVNAHKETAGSEKLSELTPSSKNGKSPSKEIRKAYSENKVLTVPQADQLIKKEEREVGATGFKPYIIYLKQDKGFWLFGLAALFNLTFVVGQILQNSWMAAKVDDPSPSLLYVIIVYLLIGLVAVLFLLARSLLTVVMGMRASRALFSRLLMSLFRAPMMFYDSTPLGRILSRVSTDLSITDLDVPFNLIFTVGSTTNCYSNLVVLTCVTWQVLIVAIPVVILAVRLQRYYFASAKHLMRINGTTKSFIANHLAESLAGVMTIRAFKEEDRFFAKNLRLIDINGSPYLHYFASNEWLIQRLETLSATVLSFAGLFMVLLPEGTFNSGFIGMALSYGLSLNMSLVFSINNQCMLSNYIVSVERLDQYMHIQSEAPEVIEENRPPPNWPAVGKVEIQNLQIRYRPEAPLVLRGITCTFEGGYKVGIVGRTGSGKTTLIGALFRLVEPSGGRIVVDGIDITRIGLHDLRSRFGIIPQDPTLFNGTVRFNLDPLGQHTDQDIWQVLQKCQLKEAVQEKEGGLDSPVLEDGSNWSMGQRQLFCLGRALLRRSKILVLDEATASIDNTTDMILQKTIRREFADCTVITVAHRIPTVMDSTVVLAIKDGKLMEFDEPMKLMKREDSLFGQLVKEYWSHSQAEQPS